MAANGARFQVVEPHSSERDAAPLVLFLHGFPEFWWAWRWQLPVAADAGYRAAAMDLRGYGGSDKTPRGYDPITLAADVAGVVKALGAGNAILVGSGWGGYVAWATAALHSRQVSAIASVCAPHPLVMLRALGAGRRLVALRHILAMQVPMLPERRLSDPASGFLGDHLRSWSSPSSAFPDDEEVATYQQAMSLWPAPHCALEYHRWLARSRVRADGRAFTAAMSKPTPQPVLMVQGADDPVIPARGIDRSERHVRGDYRRERIGRAGHFPHEEQPDAFNRVLLDWLARMGDAVDQG